jgi:hypothetical protein
MVTFANRAKVSTATTGAGTITLGAAELRSQTFGGAGLVDGDVVRYTIEDGNNFEIGTGTYTAAGTTLTRVPSESSNGGSAINLSGVAVVFVTVAAEDLAGALNTFVFDTRAIAEAASPPPAAKVIWVKSDSGRYLPYEINDSSTALTTADTRTWGPAMFVASPDWFNIPVYETESEAITAAAGMDAGQIATYQAKLNGMISERTGEVWITGFLLCFDRMIVNPKVKILGARPKETCGFVFPANANLNALDYMTTTSGKSLHVENLSFFCYQDPSETVRAELIQHPPVINISANDHSVLRDIRISMAMTGIVGLGTTGGTNPGGSELLNIEVSAFNVGIDLDNAKHFLHCSNIDFWPFGFPGNANLEAIAADGNTIGLRTGSTGGTMDDLHVDSLGGFKIRHELASSGRIPTSVGSLKLDGEGSRIVLGNGRIMIEKVYSTEVLTSPNRANIIEVNGTATDTHHQIGIINIVDSDALNSIEVINGELTVGTTAINNISNANRGIYVHAGAKFHTDRLRAQWGNATRSAYFVESQSTGVISIASLEIQDGLPSPQEFCAFGSDERGNFIWVQQARPHTVLVPANAYQGFYGNKTPTQFPTLANMKTAETGNFLSYLPDGVTVFADGVGYKRDAGVAQIAGLPNWIYTSPTFTNATVNGAITAARLAGLALLGTVSQSGGVPTGSIIERGSNANGSYVRFADGTQICSHILGGSAAGAATWTFPAVFSTTPPSIVVQASAGAARFGTADSITPSNITFSVYNTADARTAQSARLTAIGRWF